MVVQNPMKKKNNSSGRKHKLKWNDKYCACGFKQTAKTSCTAFLFSNAGEAVSIFLQVAPYSAFQLLILGFTFPWFVENNGKKDINHIKVVQNNKPIYNLYRNKKTSYIFSDKGEFKLLMRFHLPDRLEDNWFSNFARRKIWNLNSLWWFEKAGKSEKHRPAKGEIMLMHFKILFIDIKRMYRNR